MQKNKHTAEFKAGSKWGLLYTWVRKSKVADGTPMGDVQALQVELVQPPQASLTTESQRIRAPASDCAMKSVQGFWGMPGLILAPCH